MNFTEAFKTGPDHRIDLSAFDPGQTAGFAKNKKYKKLLQAHRATLTGLQYTLAAEHKQSLLIVLQGIDAAGKDGTIRKVFSAFSPQGCRVTPFKVPSKKELDHDYLWRVHQAAPGKGSIGIFNRSHYEDVLVVRVHGYVPESTWSTRYDQINQFEKHLSENGTRIIKFFLFIDSDEQRKRFEARRQDPLKQWKFSKDDVEKRTYWNDYVGAFQDMIDRCSTADAPWYVVPANNKWFRNLLVAQVTRDVLEDMNPQWPPAETGINEIEIV
jgi:PPK2 family polyphosphate:nucleotide phosphotransferase